MRASGLRVDRQLIVTSTYEEEGGFHAMGCLLGETRRPTAIAVWSLGAAIGAMAAARRGGLRLPDDLSIVAFHDAPLAAYLDPPLTTVQMALGELGARAVSLLLDLISGTPASSTVIDTPPQLVVHGSTAPPAGEP